VEVEVKDAWKGGAPTGTGLAEEKGGVALGRLQLAPAPGRYMGRREPRAALPMVPLACRVGDDGRGRPGAAWSARASC
jgi:hypothetical protein